MDVSHPWCLPPRPPISQNVPPTTTEYYVAPPVTLQVSGRTDTYQQQAGEPRCFVVVRIILGTTIFYCCTDRRSMTTWWKLPLALRSHVFPLFEPALPCCAVVLQRSTEEPLFRRSSRSHTHGPQAARTRKARPSTTLRREISNIFG